jgi:hypothetical protein
MARRKSEPLVATTSFSCDVDGAEVFVHVGDVVPATSPVVKGRESFFVPQTQYVQEGGTPPAPNAGE